MKSKANFERRQRSIDERLDRRWQPQRSEPVLEGGNVCYEVSGRTRASDCGGLGLVQEVVGWVGLDQQLDARLDLLQRHLPYSESDHVLSLAYNVLTGGQCPAAIYDQLVQLDLRTLVAPPNALVLGLAHLPNDLNHRCHESLLFRTSAVPTKPASTAAR